MADLMVFNGGLMRGQAMHWKIKGTTFFESVWTAPVYRLYSIGDHYPAMRRVDQDGISIPAELYYVPDGLLPHILAIEPPGLYAGPVELNDSRVLNGMLGEPEFIAQHGYDISTFGGWAAYPYRTPALRADNDPHEPGFELFVNGTLMRGLPLHDNLRQAPFLGVARTEAHYRIHSIDDLHPGMYRLEDAEPGGISVPGELYRIAEDVWPELAASEPANLYRGRVQLDDGSEVWGMLYPRELAERRHPDISDAGGWREYIAMSGVHR